MAKSFWEKVGQGVSRGLEKAREVGTSIGEGAEKRLDLGQARRALRRAHETLGEEVARARLDGQSRDSALDAALDDVRQARVVLERLLAASGTTDNVGEAQERRGSDEAQNGEEESSA